MKLDEVADPTMKLRMEIAKLRLQVEEQEKKIEEQDTSINNILIDMGSLNRTLAALIKKLGPRS
jgi:uncharacterized coiled-coil protein SlyX